MHYIPEVRGIEQVKGEEQVVGERELEELEKRIDDDTKAYA
jgi:hypothetical protein